MNKSIQINVDWKHKTVVLVQPKNMQLKIDEEGNIIIDDEMLRVKEKQIEQLFEEEIELVLTVEQEIKLYRSWGMALSVMIGRTADIVGIDKKLAKSIIILAQQHGFLYEGNNYTWKIIKEIRSRWLSRAKEKESYLKDPNTINRIPQTPQESIDRLEKMSTLEQKAKARGEVSIKEDIKGEASIKEDIKEESPIEVIDENKIYSPAAKAKQVEKEARDRKIQKEKEQYLNEANSVNKYVEQSLPKCVKKIASPGTKAQELPRKKLLTR